MRPQSAVACGNIRFERSGSEDATSLQNKNKQLRVLVFHDLIIILKVLTKLISFSPVDLI